MNCEIRFQVRKSIEIGQNVHKVWKFQIQPSYLFKFCSLPLPMTVFADVKFWKN